jgi:hypothetical protein
MMLDQVISGGQTGADQAAWRAAKSFRVRTGGWMPRGFLTEDGPCPEFAELYGAAEMPTESATARTERNVESSDATLWFGETMTAGAQATVQACQNFRKPFMPIHPDASFEPSHVVAWISQNQVRTLNVAGNRESDEPGIGERLERFLGQVLQQLCHART